MKTKIGLIILAASLPLMASQTLQLSSTLPDGAISPYSSTINGVASTVPNLYCDDISDDALYNQYNVQIITLAEAAGTGVGKGTGLDAGRFSAGASMSWTASLEGNTAVTVPPNSTDLYEAAAWLFAQMAGNTAQDTYIQEAAWELMTNATSVPNWSQYGNPENQESADWLKLAATYAYGTNGDTKTGSVALGTGESGVNVSLSTTTYTDWFVADAAPTCTGTGANETCGALPTTDSGGQTWQEFLIYSNNGVIINPTGGTAPEPATFGLLGGALLFGGLFARRKSQKK